MKIQSKSLLAKLLATENITVEVRADLPTAAFDPTSRTMYLPKWKDMPIGMQDLLIGHEVGHAFETPAEGWHDAICEDKTLKGFLNIIEDARIERKIKSRYPGLVKSFYAGYRELYSRDFFGVKDVDTNKLPLIDRINLHFKVGAFLNVRFSTTEQTFVNRCANTETWEEVEALARELHGKAQDDAEENIKQLSEEFEMAEQENDDSEASFEGDMSDWESEDSDDTEEEGSATGNAGDETDEDSETESSGSGDSDEDDSDEDDSDDGEEKPDAPEAVQDFVDGGGVGSITDSSFREKEKELIDDSFSKTIKYITIPTKIDLNKIITPAKTVYDWSKIEVKEQSDPKAYGEIAYREFLSKNSSTVNQMVSAFEMKRKAQLYVKAKTAKTGDLDEDRLWSYKTSDNLFKQITNIPEGKNHGFILYLDMSGSMFRNMPGTIDQLLNLTMFARKANIPFEVYGFTSDRDSWYNVRTMPPQDAKDGDYVLNDVQMIKLLDSTFSKPEIEEAYKYLLVWKQSFVARLTNTRPYVYAHDNPALSMNGTPLNATIVVAIEIAKRFRKSSNVEILNTVILTDGEATDFSEYYEGTADNYEKEFKMMSRSLKYNGEVPCFKYGSSVYEFLKGHYAHRNVELTASLLEMYKDITGSRVINYHLVDKWTKRNLEECKDYATVGNPAFGYSEWEDLWAAQKGSGLVEIKDKNGFDVRYIMNGASLNIKDEDLTVKSNKKGDLLRGFRKFAGSKSQQRVFVQKFIPEIA